MRRSPFFIVLPILSLTLLPYFILAFFTVPSADDFFQASESLEKGLFDYVKWRYLTWNGRYTADFLVAFYNIAGHKLSNNFLIKYYYVSSFIFLFFYAISNFFFILILFGKKHLKTGCIFSLVALISCLSNTEIRSTFFWFSGGIAYTLSNLLFIVLVSLLTRFFYVKPEKWLFWASLILIPIINGLSETNMVACTTFVLGLSLINTCLPNFRDELKIKKVAFSAIAISSALIVYMAPGNTARLSADGEPEINYISIIGKTIAFGSLKVFHWVNPFWISLILITVLLSRNFFYAEEKKVFEDKKVFTTLIISLLLAFFTSYLARFYSLSSAGPLRADSTSYTIFFLITVFIGFFIGLNLNFSKIFTESIMKKFLIGFISLFCGFSFVSTNSFYILKNEFKLLKNHYSYYRESYAILKQANSDSEVELTPEPRVKILRWKCYLTDEKDYWVNKAVANYFGIKSVVVIGGGGTDPDASGTGECGG